MGTIKEAEIGPPVLFDSSFVLALLDPRDPNFKSVKSIFGFLEPFGCRYYIPVYVFVEVVSRTIQKEGTVAKALKKIEDFIKGLNGTPSLGSNPNLEEIITRYKNLARKKVRFLKSSDFIIATEGISLKALILTCDAEMYEKVIKNYNDIYFVASNAKKYQNDVGKLTEKLLKLSSK